MIQKYALVKFEGGGNRGQDKLNQDSLILMNFSELMGGKLATIGSSGSKIWAEMGIDPEGFPGPCVILSQDEKENLVGVVLATVETDLIKQFDLCIVPTPRSALRTGEYPK